MVTSNSSCIEEANELIWGKTPIKEEVFQRWSQGFLFSDSEPSALQQDDGGPCAVITAVQAAILRIILFEKKQALEDVDENDGIDLLTSALVQILMLVSHDHNYKLVYIEDDPVISASQLNEPQEGSSTHVQPPRQQSSYSFFMENLRCLDLNDVDELMGCVLSLCLGWQGPYGVLCFLYSALLSHKLVNLRASMAEEADTLIDPVHGHASQCLLNLLVTGQSTPYLFDGSRDLNGFIMVGIAKQPQTGFLTILEAMRYCEVGWFLKNPSIPVWVLGSETHLTVLFSTEIRLIQNDSKFRNAEKVFHQLDSADNGFLPRSQLSSLLSACQITTDNDSINRIVKRLDPEDLGIILKHTFLQEFFPIEMNAQQNPLKDFSLYHYNPLPRSNIDGKVRYRRGTASICEVVDLTKDEEAPYLSDSSPMQRVLLTKWPTILVKWENDGIPSLN